LKLRTDRRALFHSGDCQRLLLLLLLLFAPVLLFDWPALGPIAALFLQNERRLRSARAAEWREISVLSVRAVTARVGRSRNF